MRNTLLGEIWESFFVEGHKVGFLRRLTSVTEAPNRLITHLHIVYGAIHFQHIYSFYDEVGYPTHSYLFDTNDGAPVHVRFADNKMTCQVDEHIFTEVIPADARPSYGNFPLVVTMPFEQGFKLSFTQIEDASCTVQGTTELVSHGWKNVVIDNQQHRLWLVSEYSNGQSGNRYWLNEDRQIRMSQWQGALSYWAATKEEALSDLPTEFVDRASGLFNEDDNSDWTTEIEDWFGQNK